MTGDATEELRDELGEFVAAVPFGQALLDALAAEHVGLMGVSRILGSDAWLIPILLPKEFSSKFQEQLARVAVLPSRGGAAQVAMALREGGTAPLDLVLIAYSEDFTGRMRLPGFWGQQAHLPFWPDAAGDWKLLVESPRLPVLATLARGMKSFDLFDRRDPVPLGSRRSRGVVLDDLANTLLAGQSVGLFGLRKIGKTSVSRSVADEIDPSWDGRTPAGARHASRGGSAPGRVVVVWLDVQGLTNRTRDGLAARLAGLLRARLGATSLQKREPQGRTSVAELAALLDHCSSRRVYVCFMLDEQDLLFTNADRPLGMPGIVEVFALLRAHAQQGGFCSVMLIGRDPRWLQAPVMDGVTSPTPGWVRARWLGPLTLDESREVFSYAAARTGMTADEATCNLVYEWTGGHPFLLRQLGSAFWQVIDPGSHRGPHAEMTPFHDRALAAFRERDAVVETCQEVEHLLAARGGTVAASFWRVARGRSPAALSEEDAATLRKLGLLMGPPDEPTVARVWQWWSKFVATPPMAKAG